MTDSISPMVYPTLATKSPRVKVKDLLQDTKIITSSQQFFVRQKEYKMSVLLKMNGVLAREKLYVSLFTYMQIHVENKQTSQQSLTT